MDYGELALTLETESNSLNLLQKPKEVLLKLSIR
jgi:hypothetical protein